MVSVDMPREVPRSKVRFPSWALALGAMGLAALVSLALQGAVPGDLAENAACGRAASAKASSFVHVPFKGCVRR